MNECRGLPIEDIVFSDKAVVFTFKGSRVYVPSKKVFLTIIRNLQNGLPPLFAGCLVDVD